MNKPLDGPLDGPLDACCIHSIGSSRAMAAPRDGRCVCGTCSTHPDRFLRR